MSVEEDVKEDPLADLGKRKRTEINYAGEVSDTQWLRMVDEGKNPDEEIERRRKKRQEQLDAEGNGTALANDGLAQEAEDYGEGLDNVADINRQFLN